MKHIKHTARLTLAFIAGVAALIGCQSPAMPTSAEIESVAMSAVQKNDVKAERRLRDWAAQGLSVAQRELGILYESRPKQHDEAIGLLTHAAHAGDTEAAFQLGEMLRGAAPAQAIPWYEQAAQQKHAKAALMLGMLFNNGQGTAPDAEQGARWLALASDLGDAHAMFLLSNAYREGRGVERDPVHARRLLEQAAEHEYPPALQELAMTVQTGDALSGKDELRAAHLLKEAAEHRHNNWNRF